MKHTLTFCNIRISCFTNSTCLYKTYRYGVVMEFLTQSKTIEVPILVCWKKLASILLGVDVLYSGEVERETQHILKTGKGALDVLRHADGGQNM